MVVVKFNDVKFNYDCILLELIYLFGEKAIFILKFEHLLYAVKFNENNCILLEEL
jgi:hypothetical protein